MAQTRFFIVQRKIIIIMRISKLFTKSSKNNPQGETAANAILLQRAGFIDKVMAGVYSFLPLGLRVLHKIENIIREEMNEVDGQEVVMPVLQPKKNWEQTGRWNNLDVLFRFTSFYTKNELVLGPTHEEIVAPLLKKFIFSYKDLPRYVFQIQTKFRDEHRAKSGLLRGREFMMKDLYSFHADQADLDGYYEVMKGAYKKVFDRVGLGGKTILTFASGGTFSKYSHEFQTILDEGEDTIYLCEQCRIAINKEIIHEQSACPECGSKKLNPVKASEVGNIFKLGTKYSVPFGVKYRDGEGFEKDVYMGCYGIGPSRVMGVVVEASHDANGIIWPKTIAPYLVHLICLDEDARSESEKLYNELLEKRIEVLYDDRVETSPGERFADADLIGIPFRIVISKKTLITKKMELKKRNEKYSVLVDKRNLLKLLA